MLENKVATSLKISTALVTLAIVHGLGNFLGNIFLLSDIFTVVGAIGVYRFLTDSYVREELSESISDAIDLDEAATFLVSKGVDFAENLGVDTETFLNNEEVMFFFNGENDVDELEDTFAQDEDEQLNEF